MVVEVWLGRRSAWILAALPGPLFLLLFCGLLAYGMAHFVKTGRRWAQAELLNRIAARLNSNI
jgi:hypothetical protein